MATLSQTPKPLPPGKESLSQAANSWRREEKEGTAGSAHRANRTQIYSATGKNACQSKTAAWAENKDSFSSYIHRNG